jgi:hypothetical protein
MGLVLLLVAVAAVTQAQWCLVEPGQRTDCLFNDESNCTAFGCCWAGEAQRPQCFDPENGCVGPALTPARVAQLLGVKNEAFVGQAGLRATTRQCVDGNCSWVDADDTVKLRFGPMLQCATGGCPPLSFFLFNYSGFVSAALAISSNSPCETPHGDVDFRTGLIEPFGICYGAVTLTDGQPLTMARGYSTDKCAHFTSPVYELGKQQGSFPIRIPFAFF